MPRKRLAGALLAALGLTIPFAASAAVSIRIHAGKLGQSPDTDLPRRLGLDAGTTLTATAHVRTAHNTVKTRLQQQFAGLPVYGRHLVVERATDGSIVGVEGLAAGGLPLDLPSTRARLSASQAQAALKARLGHTALPSEGEQGTLFIYPDAAKARLVYRVSYRVWAGNRLSRPTALVDANSGDILSTWEGLTTGRRPPDTSTPVPVEATGPGGNELTGLYHYDGIGAGHELLPAQRTGNTCYLQDADVSTYNLAGGQRVVQWSFGCAGNDSTRWVSSGDAINGAFSPVNDAHHFGGVVHDMYQDWFGESPLVTDAGTPMQLSMWVHYGTNYENAFWDGSEMVFGDGDQYFYPFVVLDVTGHEISHGFTEQHAALEYVGQSGGMNEAFSDMAGEAVKYYDRGVNDFLVGADMVKPATVPLLGMPALRDMCTPSRDGQSIDNAGAYYDGLDVHYSSGVYNRAFCTLAKTSGWNTRKAFEVFHDANALYWGPRETFASGACGVQRAAGDRGYGVADVTAAFAAVGVTCPQI
ncbi:M4 family metallopeptidase [Aerosticca soli]|uniref:Neutral metalloproteinase n=1 Tax=Aerosticca soli TaxID=2010829 RepID=A0A2Z6E8M6_9GAMM|nr:M4 family metallopeptidase [Aerosticca soli]BBD81192.1 vibriolysin, extracellular zinc protease [Aerosticca soli]